MISGGCGTFARGKYQTRRKATARIKAALVIIGLIMPTHLLFDLKLLCHANDIGKDLVRLLVVFELRG